MALTPPTFRHSLLSFTHQLCLAASLIFLTARGAGAQEANPQEPDARPSAAMNARAPLFWADGITQVSDLDAYQGLGFNTVVVRLTWQASEGGEISAVNLGPQRKFAEAAAKQGLNVIYALPAAPTGIDGSFRLSADSDAYVALWTTWLQDAMASLRGTTNLIGWMLPDDPRGLPIFDDLGFQRWLGQNYANQDVINRQWNSSFASIDDIGMSDISQLISNWAGDSLPTQDEINSGAGEVTHRAFGQNWAFHPAALALAHYKWDAYRALMTAWVGAVRGEDNAHLVFSGRTPDYAQLLSMPAGIDVSVPDMSPGVAEDDIVTHNPQSIDIARRGGKFSVIPMLTPRQSPQLPIASIPELTKRWIDEAWTHGARGISFDSWDDIDQVPGLATAIGSEIEKLLQPATVGEWGEPPVNTTAVLLTPLADGATLQFGMPPNQTARGLYGFGDDLVNGEPSNLVWMLRWGTAFGGIDYLSPDDLGEAPLDRYTTIMAPQTLSATGDTTTALTNYVGNGGVLISDLGMGALQNGGQVNALPPPAAALFGVPGTFDVRPLSFNLVGVAGHPLLPTWSGIIADRPAPNLTLGDGPDGTAFAGPTGVSPVPPTAQIVAIGKRLGQNVNGDNRVTSTQLTINSVGRGYAIFAPFRLWNYWRPGHVGFDTFFGEMMSRGATVVMAGASSMVPSPVMAEMGAPLYPEIVNHASGFTLTNHSAKTPTPQLAAIETSGAGDWLWSGALTHFPEGADFPVSTGRQAPIEDATQFEMRPHAVALYDVLPFGESHNLTMRPIAAQNLGGGPLAAQIKEEKQHLIRLNIWPNSGKVLPAVTEWQSTVGAPAQTRVTVVSTLGGYDAPPGSKHRCVVVDYSKAVGKNKFQTSESVAVAGADGRLVFEFTGAACDVTIAPYVELPNVKKKK